MITSVRLIIVIAWATAFNRLCPQMDAPKLPAGKAILSMSDSRAANLLKAIGYTNRFTSGISRSSNGDRVFIEFEDRGTSKVAVVSCTGVVVKELPGHCRIDDTETPVFWTSWTNGSHTPISFRVAGALPQGVNTCGWVSDANFVALFEQGQDHWWIAKVQTPLEKLVIFDWKHE